MLKVKSGQNGAEEEEGSVSAFGMHVPHPSRVKTFPSPQGYQHGFRADGRKSVSSTHSNTFLHKISKHFRNTQLHHTDAKEGNSRVFRAGKRARGAASGFSDEAP